MNNHLVILVKHKGAIAVLFKRARLVDLSHLPNLSDVGSIYVSAVVSATQFYTTNGNIVKVWRLNYHLEPLRAESSPEVTIQASALE